MASVLIVDDEELLHKILSLILPRGGHNIVGHAYHGTEAIQMYVQSSSKPDIILMDHRMPIMNGVVVTKAILALNPGAKIIFISADETIKKEAMEVGALAFLTKPIEIAELFAAIDGFMLEGIK